MTSVLHNLGNETVNSKLDQQIPLQRNLSAAWIILLQTFKGALFGLTHILCFFLTNTCILLIWFKH